MQAMSWTTSLTAAIAFAGILAGLAASPADAVRLLRMKGAGPDEGEPGLEPDRPAGGSPRPSTASDLTDGTPNCRLGCRAPGRYCARSGGDGGGLAGSGPD
jgi:hypothetical protein